ncbi:MAG: phosphoglucosamine mutase [Actinomycetota bacterium]|nr:phosphoglucosamine mutase [Actinomycetota bacterium]
MGKLFGTDGIRGVANADLTPDLVLAVGRAAGYVLGAAGADVVVGRDTRISGPMLEGALVAGLCSAGANVRTIGILPTPGIAFLTVDSGAAGGAVVSASHNPVPDNGVKFFSPSGMKVTTTLEDQIEELLSDPRTDLPRGEGVGTVTPLADGTERYLEHLSGTLPRKLDGLKVALDCAYGAAWDVAPRAFKEAGADVVAINNAPDGTRINVDCGSTSLQALSRLVVEKGADVGFAFDGDADRVLACDEHGRQIDGDRIIALCAISLHDGGALKGDVVVVTVMTNLGFRRALEARGIEVIAAPVGDRHVAEAMLDRGAVLGGEQSGHVIFSDHATTGDGVLTGLQVAAAIKDSGTPLSATGSLFEEVPQVLLNVRVAHRERLEEATELWEEVARAEESLGEDGRVLLRPSGTEPLVRVMVEAVAPGRAEKVASDLASLVEKHLS